MNTQEREFNNADCVSGGSGLSEMKSPVDVQEMNPNMVSGYNQHEGKRIA